MDEYPMDWSIKTQVRITCKKPIAIANGNL